MFPVDRCLRSANNPTIKLVSDQCSMFKTAFQDNEMFCLTSLIKDRIDRSEEKFGHDRYAAFQSNFSFAFSGCRHDRYH
jgi:hypothetical protein